MRLCAAACGCVRGGNNESDRICTATSENGRRAAAGPGADWTERSSTGVHGRLAASPWCGAADSADVGGVIIKVKKIGSPTDSTYLLRYTQTVGATPVAATKGMWMGDGDLFEINNNTNVLALK